MTSPGGSWYGEFLDKSLGNAPGTSDRVRGGSPTGSTNSSPQGRQLSPTPPVRQGGPGAAALYDILGAPEERANDVFTMSVERDPQASPDGRVVRMTVEAGLEWLRDQAVKNREGYNAWVAKLFQGGYLAEGDVRFNTYTSKVGQAFVEAAFDVASANANSEGGAVITLADNLDSLAQGLAEWNDVSGSGAGGVKAPTRLDTKWDDDTLRSTLKATSQNILGRSLNKDEEARLLGRFREVESTWNDQRWNAEQADAAGQSTTVTDRPDPSAKADGFISEEFANEAGAQRLGGYMQVMQQMFAGGAL